MEGRQGLTHLTIEENLLTGAFTRRDGRAGIRRDLDLVYSYFPKLAERRDSMAGYTSGGEQQMCAIGRALMAGRRWSCSTSRRWGWRRRSSRRFSRS